MCKDLITLIVFLAIMSSATAWRPTGQYRPPGEQNPSPPDGLVDKVQKILSVPLGILKSIERIYSYYIDKTVPLMRPRWIAFGFLLIMYLIRVYFLEGFYIVTYALGIYLLNLLIGFLSPNIDPEDEHGDGLSEISLPSRDSEEFRPFIRKLPEFQFWFWGTRAVVFSILATFFRVFDLPVFWPILLFYFVFLFFITMKQQIMHMVKHKYVPWSTGNKGQK